MLRVIKLKNLIKRLHINSIFLIVLIGLTLTIPAMVGDIIDAHDVAAHLSWSKYFSEQFWSGDLYPRWLLGMNFGLGSPTFFFYPPIPYYFTSLFYPLRFGDTPIWSQLILSAALALIASGFTAYLWLKEITNKKTALIGSIIYMTLPYHLAFNLYWRFAFAEYWSFVWMPLMLFFSRKIIVNKSNYARVGFSVSYALLIMTHLPSTLIFTVVPFFYILYLMPKKQKFWIQIIKIIFPIFLGIGLSAIYLLPAMTTQKYVSLSDIATGMYYYSQNFLLDFSQSTNSFKLKITLFASISLILMLGLCCFGFILIRKSSQKSIIGESKYWLIVASLSIFMTLPLSKFIWDVFPILQKIQFPWRFNCVLTVATTALVTLGLYSVRQNRKPAKSLILLMVAFVVAGFLMSGFVINYQFNDTILNRLNITSEDLLISMKVDAPEYRPKWMPVEMFNVSTLSQLSRNNPRVRVAEGQGNVSIHQWQPRKILLEVKAITDVELTLSQFYYPGWTANFKGESNKLPVKPSQPEGFLSLRIPQGHHQIAVILKAGMEERLGQIISAVCSLSLVLLLLGFHQFDGRTAE